MVVNMPWVAAACVANETQDINALSLTLSQKLLALAGECLGFTELSIPTGARKPRQTQSNWVGSADRSQNEITPHSWRTEAKQARWICSLERCGEQ